MELAAQKFRSFDAVQNQRWPDGNLGVFNEPRNVAIYLNRRLRGDSLKKIAEQFQVKKYSSVSSVIERMKAAIENDRRLRSRIQNIVSELNKSQEQTWPLILSTGSKKDSFRKKLMMKFLSAEN